MDTGISLDTYKIFCAVARTGNMSSAAKELFISQPAVSMAVKQLEERLGGQLLVRTPKGVRLTPEGRVLFNYLDMAFNMVRPPSINILSWPIWKRERCASVPVMWL